MVDRWKGKRKWKGILIGLTLTVLSLEFFLQLLSLGAFLYVKYVKNDQGERDDSPETFRILAIGESTTFGLGIDPRLSYPRMVEKELNKIYPGKLFQVFNMGVPAQTSTSILRSLEFQMIKYRPHLVITLFGANDLNYALNIAHSTLLFNRFLLPEVFASLKLVKFSFLLWDYFFYRPAELGEGAWVIIREEKDRKFVIWDWTADFSRQLYRNYKNIIRIIKGHGARTLMISYINPRSFSNQIPERIMEEEGIPYLDLAMTQEELKERSLLIGDHFHPSEKGHQLMAGKIVAFLLQSGMVPP